MKNTILIIATLLSAAFTQPVHSQKTGSPTNTLSTFEAFRKGSVIQLSWVALNETGVASHEILKSTNGFSFTNIGTLVAQNNSTSYSYTFLDATPNQGINYYRLRTVDKKGSETFSDILRVDEGFTKTDLRVLGNPVQGGALNLQLKNINSGKYYFSLYTSAGERVLARSLDLTDGSLTQTINLPRNLGYGLYLLEFTNGALRINKQVMLH